MLFGKKKVVNVKIGGMHCNNCVNKVANAIKEVGGNAEVDLKLGRAAVTCPENLAPAVIKEAVEKVGFTCEIA